MENEAIERDRVKSIIEAILFVSDEPVVIKTMRDVFPDLKDKEIRELTDELAAEYKSDSKRGIFVEEVAGGWQFRTKPDLAPWLKRLKKVKPVKLSQAGLETLAIVAYKQPVTRPEIEGIRGVESGGVLQKLLDKKMIKIMGKKDAPGKPIVYGTTREFLEVFSLKDLSNLPTLKEIKDLAETKAEDQPVIQVAGSEDRQEAGEAMAGVEAKEEPEGKEE